MKQSQTQEKEPKKQNYEKAKKGQNCKEPIR